MAENLSFLFGGLKCPPTSKKDKLREPAAVEAAAAAGGGCINASIGYASRAKERYIFWW